MWYLYFIHKMSWAKSMARNDLRNYSAYIVRKWYSVTTKFCIVGELINFLLSQFWKSGLWLCMTSFIAEFSFVFNLLKGQGINPDSLIRICKIVFKWKVTGSSAMSYGAIIFMHCGIQKVLEGPRKFAFFTKSDAACTYYLDYNQIRLCFRIYIFVPFSPFLILRNRDSFSP